MLAHLPLVGVTVSAGPIRAEREAFGKRPPVSTTDAARVCKATDRRDRGYCGREAKGAKVTAEWVDVVCSDCEAAHRADQAAKR